MATATAATPNPKSAAKPQAGARRRGVALLAVVLIVLPLLVTAALLLWPRLQRDEGSLLALEAAQGLYAAGEYELAMQALEQLIEQGVDAPTVWYNLGQAAMQAGDSGSAVEALQRAHDAAPRDGEIELALQRARASLGQQANVSTPLLEAAGGPASAAPVVRVWLQALSANELALLALGAWCLLAGMVVLALRRPRGRGWAVLGMGAALMVLFVAGGALLL